MPQIQRSLGLKANGWHVKHVTNPEVGVFEVTAIILNDVLTVALLHYADLLDNLLQVRINRNLLDGQHLARLLVLSLKHTAI